MAQMLATTSYPADCVCYIVATFPDGEGYQGSGVIIGPHTVLTAAHLLWDASSSQSAVKVSVYPGYNMGGAAIGGVWAEHFNAVADANGKETEAASQSDFAVIDFSTDLSSYGSFGVATNFAGGSVHVSGYPASANGAQEDQTGTVTANGTYNTLDYGSVSVSEGASGGPLWLDPGTPGAQPTVVGLVSTTAWAVQLTSADLSVIQGWEASDAPMWSGAVQVQASQTLSVVTGGAGSDTLVGWSGGDTLWGGAGADSITGGAGFNSVNGNQGDDTIVGVSTVGDWLLGGQGDDRVTALGSTGDNLLQGNLGADTLFGGSGRDTLRGGQGDDVIHAGGGADWISGDLGQNTLYAGSGVDTFHAGAGQDTVIGWRAGDHVVVDSGVSWTVVQASGGVHITFSNGGQMDLLNVQVASLPTGWIVQT